MKVLRNASSMNMTGNFYYCSTNSITQKALFSICCIDVIYKNVQQIVKQINDKFIFHIVCRGMHSRFCNEYIYIYICTMYIGFNKSFVAGNWYSDCMYARANIHEKILYYVIIKHMLCVILSIKLFTYI